MLIKEENIVLQKLAAISECFFSLDKWLYKHAVPYQPKSGPPPKCLQGPPNGDLSKKFSTLCYISRPNGVQNKRS